MTEKLELLATRIREVHPYDLPEVIALQVVGGDDDYLAWISEALRGTVRPEE